MRILASLIVLFTAVAPFPARSATPEPVPTELLERIRERSGQNEAALSSLAYLADSVTEVMNAQGRVEKHIASTRRVTRRGSETTMDYQRMSVNGRALSAEEMKAELAGSRGRQQGLSPFLPGEMDKYRFEPAGNTRLAGAEAWVVAYQPLTPTAELAVGRGYIDTATYDLRRLEFSPSQRSAVVKQMRAVLDFQRLERASVPAALTMQLHIKVDFIFTLADQQVRIRERYYDWTFSGL